MRRKALGPWEGGWSARLVRAARAGYYRQERESYESRAAQYPTGVCMPVGEIESTAYETAEDQLRRQAEKSCLMYRPAGGKGPYFVWRNGSAFAGGAYSSFEEAELALAAEGLAVSKDGGRRGNYYGGDFDVVWPIGRA